MKLPKDWSLKPLSALVDAKRPISYGVVQTGEPVAEGIPCVRVIDLASGRPDRSSMIKTTQKISQSYARTILAKGDVIIALRGEIGRAALISKALEGANLTRGIALLACAGMKMDSRFMFQSLGCQHVRREIMHGVNGTSLREIPITNLRKVCLPVPPLAEQRKIADILSTWDEALTQLDALIEAQERRKKALIQQLLTGRRRLKGFSKQWKHYRFSEVLEPQDRYVEFDDDDTYSLVSIRRRSGGVFFREALQGGEIKTKVMKRVHKGDFLISRMQVVHGALGMVRPECDGMYASDSYDVLVTKNAKILHMPFLDWMSRMRSFWHLAYISSHGVHIEKMTFKLSDFMHEKIRLPSDLEEQRQIAAILDTADQQLTLLRTQRTALDQQKRGLMQRLLTGKLRVKH